MKLTATLTVVLTIPLVVKPSEDRMLIGLMGVSRHLYNAILGEYLRLHGLLKQSKGWHYDRTIINKKLHGNEFQWLSKEAGFTAASIISFVRTCRNETGWKDLLGSNISQRIAEQVFAVVQQQYTFGKRRWSRLKHGAPS